MHNFARLKEVDRRQAFLEAAAETGLDRAVVEKDFWICWTLEQLFEISKYQDAFSFKGGTSLSKAHHLIERMSEDIDLILDWRLLGYGVLEPWVQRSNTKQDQFIKEANSRAAEFVSNSLMGELKQLFSEALNEPFMLYVDADDPQTLCFDYPKSFENLGLLQQIRLETGALAAWTPAASASVTPYIAEVLPDLFVKPAAMVLAVAPERTFWEKATILHREAYRTSGRLPARYSRHYYDLYRLSQTVVKSLAFSNMELLAQVVDFKMRFYRLNSARYDLARDSRTLKLIPPDNVVNLLKNDYRSMKSMFFGEAPSFDEVLSAINQLEAELRTL